MSLPDSNHPNETKRGAQKATPLGLAGFLEAKGDCMATGVVCNPRIMIEHRFEIQDMRETASGGTGMVPAPLHSWLTWQIGVPLWDHIIRAQPTQSRSREAGPYSSGSKTKEEWSQEPGESKRSKGFRTGSSEQRHPGSGFSSKLEQTCKTQEPTNQPPAAESSP